MRINFQNIYFKPIQQRKQQNANCATLPVLKNDVFESRLQTFTGMRCSPDSFKIKELDDLRCPACGLVMLNGEQQKKFIGDVYNKTGQKLVKTLEAYEDETIILKDKSKSKQRSIYRPLKQEVVNVIKELALKYPDKKIDELVKIQAQTALDELIKKQLAVVGELEEYVNANIKSNEEWQNIFEITAKYKAQIVGEDAEQFQRKRFIYALSNVTADEKAQKEINKIISKLPNSKNEINSFFVKYSQGRSAKEIASKFVYESRSSAEHLVPQAKKGKNNTANYICDCADCNSNRGDMDFNVWMKEIPNFEENLQEYLEEVRAALDENRLDCKYETYIEDVIATIKNLSNGEIKLYPPESKDNSKKGMMLERRRKEIRRIEQEIQKQKQQRQQLKDEIGILEKHPQYKNVVQLRLTEGKIKETKLRIKSFQAKIQNSKTSTEQIQNNIKELEIKLAKLTRKKETIQGDIDSTVDIEDRIREKEAQIFAVNVINGKINELTSQTKEEPRLLERKEFLQKETGELQAKNESILQTKKIDEDGKEKYQKALHCEKLLETAQENINELNKKRRKQNKDMIELLDLSIEILERRLATLNMQPSVQFYRNSEKIEKNQIEIQKIQKKLDEIATIKKMIESLEKQALENGDNKTIQQLTAEYQILLDERKVIEKIKGIDKLRTQLKQLEETISYNEGVLSQLHDYRTMTSEKFTSLVDGIYC